jgi:hemoglobin/transferrin/lactoferrin receptor protein
LRPEFGYAGQRFDVMAAVSWKDFGDLEGGREQGLQPKTGYEERTADFKLHFDLAENQEIVAAVQHVDQDDAWRVHKTVFGKSWEGTTVGNELCRSLSQARTLSYVQFRASNLGRNLSDVVVSVSYHQQNEERIRIRSDGRTDLQAVDVGTTGLFGHALITSPVGDITAGLEYYGDNVDSTRTDYNADGTLRAIRIQGPVADDANYSTAAAFLQDQIAVGERTRLVLGLRYTEASADAQRVQDPETGEALRVRDDWSATTASVRFSHALGGESQASIFGGLSQGFRAPNLSDLTRFDTARSNEIETPVANLDAENFLSYEIGFKYVSDRWSSQFAVYFTDIDDMVIRTPTGNIIDGNEEVTKRNSGAGFVQGVEVQSRYRINDAWSIHGNLTWMDGEIGTYPSSEPILVDEPIDRLMPLSATLGLRWTPDASAWWFEGQLSYAARQDKLSTRDAADTDRIPLGGTPGYTVVTLRGGWRISRDLSLSAALENLFDADYRIHGSGLNEPGRNLVMTLIWNPI